MSPEPGGRRGMPPLVAGRRIRLRPLLWTDAPALLAIYGDPEVMRFWNHAPWTSLAQAHAAIADSHAEYLEDGSAHWAIEDLASGTLMGSCALYALDPCHRRALMGYMLAPCYWAQGYGAETIGLVLEHGMHALQLNRVEAEIDVRNTASIRALERAGFRHEGKLRQRWIVGGRTVDIALYSLLRDDWLPCATTAAATRPHSHINLS